MVYRDVSTTWKVNFEFEKDKNYEADIYPKLRSDNYNMNLTPSTLFQQAEYHEKFFISRFKKPISFDLKKDDSESETEVLCKDLSSAIETERVKLTF